MKKIQIIMVLLCLMAICLFPTACGKGPVVPDAPGGSLFSAQTIPPGAGSVWHQVTAGATWSRRTSFRSLVYNNKVWILGGWISGTSTDEVWNTLNGNAWTKTSGSGSGVPFTSRYLQSDLVFENKMWAIGGLCYVPPAPFFPLNDIWSSSDGVTWNMASSGASIFTPRYAHSSVVYKNKAWVIGGDAWALGYKGDVWSSMDAIHWTPVTPMGPFGPRFHHTTVVFNPATGSGVDGLMWLIGGSPSSIGGYKNDVWYSADGATWTLATAAAPFSPRAFHSSVVFGGAIWVMGGTDGVSPLKDAWYSYDGYHWAEASSAVTFGPRELFASVVFNLGMWVMGGYDGANARNDVWYSP